MTILGMTAKEKNCTVWFSDNRKTQEVETNYGWLMESMGKGIPWLIFESKIEDTDLIHINLNNINTVEVRFYKRGNSDY